MNDNPLRTTDIGNIGEEIAAQTLIRDGYKVLYKNWKVPAAEIDIIAQKSSTIYFIEVKYRKSGMQGDGFDYITPKKLHHMQRAAELWVASNDWKGEYVLLAAAVNGITKEADIREI